MGGNQCFYLGFISKVYLSDIIAIHFDGSIFQEIPVEQYHSHQILQLPLLQRLVQHYQI